MTECTLGFELLAMHEAAKQRCTDIVDLLTNDGNVNIKGEYVTPLGVTVECGHCDVLEHLNHNPMLSGKGGHVKTLADDCASVLFKTGGGRSLGCIALLLEYGGSGNVPNEAGLLPIHKVACEGHYLAKKYLIAATTQTAHSALDGQNQFLELVIENGLDVSTLLTEHVTSDAYDLKEGDGRKTALYCAVSNSEILCTEILLKAGANANKDPLKCVCVAVRADSHGIVKLLLSYGADVNLILLLNDMHFPSAYPLNGDMMLRLLLSHGYNVEMCLDFMCQGIFGNSFVQPAPSTNLDYFLNKG
ncbi:LOW QUALITY PROTEIN: ankyrin repeat and SOCS box protein 15 [Cyanocitta cristata]